MAFGKCSLKFCILEWLLNCKSIKQWIQLASDRSACVNVATLHLHAIGVCQMSRDLIVFIGNKLAECINRIKRTPVYDHCINGKRSGQNAAGCMVYYFYYYSKKY